MRGHEVVIAGHGLEQVLVEPKKLALNSATVTAWAEIQASQDGREFTHDQKITLPI